VAAARPAGRGGGLSRLVPGGGARQAPPRAESAAGKRRRGGWTSRSAPRSSPATPISAGWEGQAAWSRGRARTPRGAHARARPLPPCCLIAGEDSIMVLAGGNERASRRSKLGNQR